MSLKFLIEKEFKQFIRHAFIPKMVIIFPIMMMLIMPWVISFDIKDISIVLVDQDRSTLSQELCRHIDNSAYFKLIDVLPDHEEASKMIEYGKADMLAVIPTSFEYDLISSYHADLLIEVNSVNTIKGSLGGSYLSMITTEMSREILAESQAGAMQMVPNINISHQYLFNPLLDSKFFMIPALMIIILVLICGFLPALNIVLEKEDGTIEQINVTPVKKLTFIVAKLIPYWIVGFIVLTICFLLVWIVYGLMPAGSFLTIYILAFLFVIAITGVGLVISNYSSTIQQAMFVMFFFIIIFILISGLLTPIGSMPEWAQIISLFSPPRYFISAMRAIYLKGSGLEHIASELITLAVMSVTFTTWAILSYRKRA